MKQELMDAIQETPVIAAVKDDGGLQNALQNENIRVVFILYGDICNISTLVQRIQMEGRTLQQWQRLKLKVVLKKDASIYEPLK